MSKKNRADLKSYFVKNAIPTESNFADLIDSQLNQEQDGVFKTEGEPLAFVAAPGHQKRTVRFFASPPAPGTTPAADWMISLNPLHFSNDGPTVNSGRPGFGIADGGGFARVFIESGT